MVKLKNIRKNDSIGMCDIIPEDSSSSGYIIVDLVTEEVKEYSLPVGYEWCVKHVYHAARNLVSLFNENNTLDEYLVMWG